MTLKDSIDRLYWRLKNGSWKPNQTDVDAVNELVTYVNNSKKQDIKENILFTKMYVMMLTIYTDKYKDPNFAQVQLHKQLKRKTLQHYENFHNVINTIEFEKFCDILNIEVDYLKPLNEETQKQQGEIIAENQTAFIRHVKGLWDFDAIRIKLNDQVSEAFNKYHQIK